MNGCFLQTRDLAGSTWPWLRVTSMLPIGKFWAWSLVSIFAQKGIGLLGEIVAVVLSSLSMAESMFARPEASTP